MIRSEVILGLPDYEITGMEDTAGQIRIRARLKDNDQIEGLAQNDLSLLGSGGLFLIPPDTRSNTQRIFLPRQAVAELDVVRCKTRELVEPQQNPNIGHCGITSCGEILKNV